MLHWASTNPQLLAPTPRLTIITTEPQVQVQSHDGGKGPNAHAPSPKQCSEMYSLRLTIEIH